MIRWPSVLGSPHAIWWKLLSPHIHLPGRRATQSVFPVPVSLRGCALLALLSRQPYRRFAHLACVRSTLRSPSESDFTGLSQTPWGRLRLLRSFSLCLTVRSRRFFIVSGCLKPSACWG